ncbi:galactokinase [Alteribacter populi]|uniref:galactokinase n=1 Tax=Alteribacter populi TaxID=2011011 RepID=UPI000BBA9815|nr:galactokinase [Alteribacter populi]
MNYEQLIHEFKAKFSSEEARLFFAPGRINLIGEHTDYNGGNVFPCAITYGTYAVAKKRDDYLVRLYSVNFPNKNMIEFNLNDLDYKEKDGWANYPKGMLRYIRERGDDLTGMDVLFYGNIPNAAGLSSSASIELLTGVVIEKLNQLSIDRLELVKIGMRVENEFIGVKSGIMDQFAVGMGKKEEGILLDCQTLDYHYAPLKLGSKKVLIMNTNKRRELAASKYNERRNECEQALKQIQTAIDVLALGELSEEDFEQIKHTIKNPTVLKRAKHAVYENQRTIQALQALKNDDLSRFGELMNDSHTSLKEDYEVTGFELDTLVETAWKQDGVLGARMTGAGFGGCAIAIVEEKCVDNFIENVGTRYKEKVGYEADFYIASIGDGARELEMEVRI